MATLPQNWVGSISEGTMRAQDLLPRFVATIKAAEPDHIVVHDWDRLWSAITTIAEFVDVEPMYVAEGLGIWEDEHISYFLNEDVFDALNQVAPENTYFGSSEGDGASYGFWYVDCDICGESM